MCGIGCGQNNVILGDIVDQNKEITGEVVNIAFGDITLGHLVSLKKMTMASEVYTLGKIWNKYQDKIPPLANLYVVETNGLSGTIYVCGHYEKGVWAVFAKTAGYA